ncbi:MAG: hypothetical protein GVY05_08920 [Bacteroidetes bacterium]|nr:hypothetical protein [Bacteroidota bacterium]
MLKVMDSVLVKLEDAKNTQESLLEKLGHIEVELFDIQSKELDAEIEKIKSSASDAFETIIESIENFETKKNEIQNNQ